MESMQRNRNQNLYWWLGIITLIIIISFLHYITPTMRWQYHLIYMQSYFIPIMIAALRFGIKGGVVIALVVSIAYLPHIMLHWGGFIETNLMRFLQIILFNVIGFFTGYLAQKEKRETMRYQQAARQLEENLHQIRGQSEKIQALEEQLRISDRLAVVGELTASLAHEIRNPLASIRGTIDILQDELPNALSESEWFKIMQRESERMNRVVDNYLNFSKKTHGEKSKFDVREIIENAHLMLAAQFRKRNIKLELDIPEDSLFISGNSDHLWQVLTNLLLNALQSFEDGQSGRVRIKSNVKEADDHFVQLLIEDDGCGISKEQHENIFRPFITTKKDGTGLGLAIVKRIVESNGWEIQVESEAGKGSIFKLTIPTHLVN